MRHLIMFLPLVAFAGEPDGLAERERAEREAAQKLLERVYRSPETARYCLANPEAIYRTTVASIVFDVDCKTRNDWIEYAAKK